MLFLPHKASPEHHITPPPSPTVPPSDNKHPDIYTSPNQSHAPSSPLQQAGVRKVEATAQTWTKWDLIAAYGLIWLYYFASSTAEVVTRTLNPYVTSSFGKHSTSAAVNIVSSIVGGVSKLPLAKVLDTWGRPHGLSVMVLVWALGYIMTASARTIEAYAASLVFSAVGSQGVSYCVTVFIADTSSLRNRALMLAFATSPYIVTTPISGLIARRIVHSAGWRWGFGLWAIVMPLIMAPLCLVFFSNQHKATKAGLLPTEKNQPENNSHFSPEHAIKTKTRALARSVGRYLVDVDAVGILLLAVGWTFFLLPFSLYSYQALRWRSPLVLGLLLAGALLLLGFCLWERRLATAITQKPALIPRRLLADRTVLFGGLMFAFLFAASAVWRGYFTSLLLVAWDLGPDRTAWVLNVYRIGSCLAALVLGLLMRTTGRFRWVAALYGLPLMLLGVGLMLRLRPSGGGGGGEIGLLVVTQILIALAGGPIVVAGEMAMMTPSDHQHVAIVVAVLDLFASVGFAVGSTISGAIWTATFRRELAARLPKTGVTSVDAVYASIEVQLSYEAGSAARSAIADAYTASQRLMLAASLGLLTAAWACVWAWRDLSIRDRKQVRGVVV